MFGVIPTLGLLWIILPWAFMRKIYVRYVFVSLVYIPKNEITGSCGSPVFNILRSCKLFSKVVALFYHPIRNIFSSVHFSRSVVSDSLWHHGLQHATLPCPSPIMELAQTHVRWVDHAIQSSHPLSSPSPPTFSLSQNEGLFQWVSSSHQVAKVLEFQL